MKPVILAQLAHQVDKYLTVLEGLFGPRDSRFVFGTIRRSTHPKGDPQTYFVSGYHENGGCVVDIHISPDVHDKSTRARATWQIAHECVHLLDPCKDGETNILEEGLATWFQCERSFHPGFVQLFLGTRIPLPERYTEAMLLVQQCMPELATSIRNIRSKGVRIKDIEPQFLENLTHSGEIEHTAIKRLCETFGGSQR